MKYGLLAFVLMFSSSVFAAEYTVSQKNKKFIYEKDNKYKVGDTIHFKNDDSFFHNIYSLSDTQSFDLGSYPQGQSRPVVIEKKGTIMIECAIHPQMQLEIVVE